MFRGSSITINGVAIPPHDSEIRSIVGNTVIYEDGTYVAIDGKKIVKGTVPKSGMLQSGDSSILVRAGGVTVIKSSVTHSSSHITIDGNVDMHDIDEKYNFSVGRVFASSLSGDISLLLNGENYVHVQGTTEGRPPHSPNMLVLRGFSGSISMPHNQGLELMLNTISGDIEGDVYHGGSLETVSGRMDLALHAPLMVEVQSIAGKVSINGLLAKDNCYVPPNAEPQGTLNLSTVSGKIRVSYKG